MAFNNLPPQAYTRDVLMAAYDWLQSQPASIRELAVGPDALVSLFMQARRRAHTSTGGPATTNTTAANHAATNTFPVSMQAPMTSVSAEAFKQDLKSLAADMKQFEEANTQTKSAPQPTPPAPIAPAAVASPVPAPASVITTMKADADLPLAALDSRTRQVLSEVKQKLNVSSEQEAMRLLIAIGYEKIRDFLPKN